jgi:hypothetical protein
VEWKILLKTTTTIAATTSAPSAAIGALSQGLRVISIFVRMSPKPPNAVTKVAMLVGLNGENPGMPLCAGSAIQMARVRIDVRFVPASAIGKERADDGKEQADAEADQVDRGDVHLRSGGPRHQMRRRGTDASAERRAMGMDRTWCRETPTALFIPASGNARGKLLI